MPRWPRGPLHYGWIVVLVTFAAGLTAAGIRAAPQVFILPLEAEFGWNRAEISVAVSLSLIFFALTAPVSGRLIDRFGPRPVLLVSMALLGLGVAGTVAINQLWQLWLLWGVLVGIGAGGGGSVMFASVATRWFVARRGMVLGLLGNVNGAGQLVFLPILMALIVSLGWRSGSVVLAAVVVALLAVVWLWMRNDPADVGLTAYGAEKAAARGGQQPDDAVFSMAQVVRTREFWLLAGSFFVCGFTANGLIGTHLIPHSLDHGIPEVTAAATVGVMATMNFVGSMISGWLTDRVDPRKVLATVYALRGSSLFLLPFMTDFPGLFLFAVIYGLDWSAALPATVAITVNRYGKRSLGSIYGWVSASHQIGAAVSATAAGVIRVSFGDYQLAFLVGGLVGLMGASMALLIRTQRVEPVAAVETTPAPV